MQFSNFLKTLTKVISDSLLQIELQGLDREYEGGQSGTMFFYDKQNCELGSIHIPREVCWLYCLLKVIPFSAELWFPAESQVFSEFYVQSRAEQDIFAKALFYPDNDLVKN